MNRIHRIRRALGALGALVGVLVLALAASPAYARPVPPDGVREFVSTPPPVTYTVVTGGMPGWQITLIAVGAALFAAAAAVLLDRARAARRHAASAAA